MITALNVLHSLSAFSTGIYVLVNVANIKDNPLTDLMQTNDFIITPTKDFLTLMTFLVLFNH